jgi:glutaminase
MTIEQLPISTGSLPPAAQVQALVDAAYAQFKDDAAGENAQYYPALARVPAHLFGICVASVDGTLFSAGDVGHPFTIMSISKPFVFALVCDVAGPAAVREQLGVNSTGLPFNSVMALDLNAGGRTNPMVNSGAIATTSLAPGATADERWAFIHAGLSRFAGRTLEVNAEVYASASASNQRNQGIARLLESYGRLGCDPATAVDLYTRQCSLDVTARDLALMAATLGDGGVHPITRDQVISADTCRRTLAVMATAGLYETSGDWLYEVGLPGKSGVGGGIITVVPGKGGLGTFAPPLDDAGNSVKGQLAAQFLSARLGLNVFASRPVEPRA